MQWAVDKIRADRSPVPPGKLFAATTPDQLQALSRLAETPAELQLPLDPRRRSATPPSVLRPPRPAAWRPCARPGRLPTTRRQSKRLTGPPPSHCVCRSPPAAGHRLRWTARSRDLQAELPALTAGVGPAVGPHPRVTVNPTHWPAIARKVPVAGHVVHGGWFLAEQDPHDLLLLSYRVGRRNLQVVLPQTVLTRPPG
ncbi:DUF5994 family protein [Streptomyces lateritius]|uniref:DUF5994 family protein n=1 Tax=Streptomyces lateritius TaxID=67313 RepID=A0ABW6YLB8_9ACTN